ncbi:pelota mRNA surveillance protein [Chloropicon primus]|uniref:Protein pelota homolog n=1 Tax=Chloropicon primus TaxID=1764295 RepID=A0A5B8MK33_9CHLO|nr:pelota mRNA surveillance protein [Chloropicon primus]UPR00009.1 pelota mRNA surveillance protein [Chloropicon primus]|mmetsp:Transcript_9134/g.25966  ORF Transcript_9134/g.25966 Transcript_9134/m.25966 type:complete len:414 (-) Transcript_9134:1308-2549(-)|eukprot:QDZ20797.1 pelota mRNA surveillance protein [Chloropicon primus]
MKLIKKDVENSDGTGLFKVEPQSEEDIWHLYNIIVVGDVVTSSTFRKVDLSSNSGNELGGSSNQQRVRLTLAVKVEAIEYDGEAAELRLRGRVTNEASDQVRVGSYHTLTIAPNRALTIEKQEAPGWDRFALDTIKKACSDKAKLGVVDLAVMLVEEGYASLHLIGSEGLSMKVAKIETRMPKKYGAAAAGIGKAQSKFFGRCAMAIAQNIDFKSIQCLVLAGPGFTKDELLKDLLLEATRTKGSIDAGDTKNAGTSLVSVLENKSKIITAHASSAFGHSLQEVLSSPEISKRIANTRASLQTDALNRFYDMLSHDDTRAFYGEVPVEAAAEMGAIQDILIVDSLFRNRNAETRIKWTKLVESVEQGGGKSFIFSSMHVSGEQLGSMGGIAAILRFPMPELDDLDGSDSESED